MTATANSRKLVRKQFLVSPAQIDKLSSLAASEKKSEAEIVRLAIDAFEPRGLAHLSIPLTTNSYYSVGCCKIYAPVGTTNLFF